MTRRTKYSKEYKLDTISLVVDQGYSRAEAARRLKWTPFIGQRGGDLKVESDIVFMLPVRAV